MGSQQASAGASSLHVPQVARILPGPAGKLQQLAAAGALDQATPEALGLKTVSGSSSSLSFNSSLHDACFQSAVWLSARAFAAQHVTGSSGTSQLQTIQDAKELSLGKVSKLLLMLGAVNPGGSGSAFSRVKDPSGSIGAALHTSFLQQLQQHGQGQGQPLLGPGTVLLLHDVSVFTPTPGTSYIAVTAKNLVRAWGAGPEGSRGVSSHLNPTSHTQHTQPQQQHAAPYNSGIQQQTQPLPGNRLQQQQQLQQQEQAGTPLPSSSQFSSGQGQHHGQWRQQQQQGLQTPKLSGNDRQQQQQSPLFAPSPDIESLLRPNSNVHSSQQQQQQPQQRQQQQQAVGVTMLPLRPVHPARFSLQGQQQQRLQVSTQQQGACGTSMPPPPPRQLQPSSFRLQALKQQQQQQQQQRPSTAELQPRFVSHSQHELSHLLADLDGVMAEGAPGTQLVGGQASMQQQQQQQQRHSDGLVSSQPGQAFTASQQQQQRMHCSGGPAERSGACGSQQQHFQAAVSPAGNNSGWNGGIGQSGIQHAAIDNRATAAGRHSTMAGSSQGAAAGNAGHLAAAAARSSQVAASCTQDDDVDNELTEDVVTAIFGSQMGAVNQRCDEAAAAAAAAARPQLLLPQVLHRSWPAAGGGAGGGAGAEPTGAAVTLTDKSSHHNKAGSAPAQGPAAKRFKTAPSGGSGAAPMQQPPQQQQQQQQHAVLGVLGSCGISNSSTGGSQPFNGNIMSNSVLNGQQPHGGKGLRAGGLGNSMAGPSSRGVTNTSAAVPGVGVGVSLLDDLLLGDDLENVFTD